MNITLLTQEKHEAQFQIDNLTVAEVLRAYLYNAGADFAAWKREHPSQPIVVKIQSNDKPVKKVVADAVALIKKDCEKILANVKK